LFDALALKTVDVSDEFPGSMLFQDAAAPDARLGVFVASMFTINPVVWMPDHMAKYVVAPEIVTDSLFVNQVPVPSAALFHPIKV
jgi:hypothetical protein